MSATRSQFQNDLETLRTRLLEMGTAVDSMVARAMRALQDQDVELAEAVINADDFIDELDVTIESECLRLIALQAPVGKDLHLLGTAIKAITDLERIADHSVDIAKVARKLAQETFFVPLVDLPKMADKVREMLKTVLTAFVSHDLAMVNYVVEADDQVDTMYHLIRDDLHNAMRRDPDVVVQASYLLFVAHYLERIADHTVNIAERVYFAETGKLAHLAQSHSPQS